MWMVNMHVKKCSTSLAIKDMQRKTAVRSYYLPSEWLF